MPRKNIHTKDYRKNRASASGERDITHEESGNRKLSKKRKSNEPNQSNKSKRRSIRNEAHLEMSSDISNPSTSSDSDSSSRILERIFCKTSSEVEILDAPGNHSGNEKNYVVKSQSTEGDGNCFFHAVFGTLCGGVYKTDKAQEMRKEWYEFLSQFESLSDKNNFMSESLRNQLTQVFQGFFSDYNSLTGGKEKFRNLIIKKLNKVQWSEDLIGKLSLIQKKELLEGSELYKIYCDCIKEQCYYIFDDEIHILASLANITIYVYDNIQYKDRPLVCKPIPEIVQEYKQKRSDLWGNKQQETIFHTRANHFSRATLSVEQSSSLLKDVFNSPTRRRNPIISKSPGKENSPKKRKYSTISQSCSFTSLNPGTGVITINHSAEKFLNDSEIGFLGKHNSRQTSTPRKKNSDGPDFRNISAIKLQRPMSKREIIQSQEKNLMTQLSHIDSGVEFADENSILPEEPSELNLSKKNCETSGRSRKLEHPPTGENDRLPGSREKRKLDFAIDEANQQSNSSNKKVRKITHNLHFVQTSTPLKNDSGLGSSLLSSSEILKSHEGLKEFLKECEEGGKIAIYCDYAGKKLSKISLSCNEDEVHYIKKDFEQDALEEINGVLSSGKVKKVIVYDIKEVKKNLPGIEEILDFVDDLKVMSYSLDTKKHDHSLSSIFEHNFNIMKETFSAENLIEVHNKLEHRLSKQEKLRKIYDDCDKPLVKVIINMEKKGVKVDVERLKESRKKLGKEIGKLEKEIVELSGGKKFDIGSPEKLKRVLFNRMKVQHKTGLSGLSGTGSKTLRMLEQKGVKIAGKILELRSLDKLKQNVNTYIEKANDGRIHAEFLTTKTKTGRLSSKDPNLQSILNDKEIRQAFIAEEEHKLISADYRQMEVKILAEIADVEKLKEAFNRGEDIYKNIAKEIFDISEEVKDEDRQKAKKATLGIIYGKSKFGLAEELGITESQANEYIKQFFSHYPEVETYKREAITDARAYGYVETMSGRRLNINYINSEILSLRKHARRSAVNAPIQGTGANIMRLAMINVSKKLKAKNLGEVINTIHDELIVEAKDGNVNKVQELMKEEMEEAAREILRTPIPVKINIGENLNFGKKMDKDQHVSGVHDITEEENEDFTTNCDDSGILQEEDDLINDYHDLGNEEYRNSFFCIVGIAYQVEVSMLCAHRAFKVHKDKYKDLKIATEKSQILVGKFDDLTIHYRKNEEDESKTINVQVKRIDVEEGYNEINATKLFPEGKRREQEMFAIDKYFRSFLKQSKEERDKIEYNIIYTNSDFVTRDGKLRSYFLEHSGIQIDKISLKEEKHEIFKDLLCADKKKDGFYKFSQEVRKKVSQLLEPLSSKIRKEVSQLLEPFSPVRKKEIEELLESPSEKTEKKIKELLKHYPEEEVKSKVLELLKPLFEVAKDYKNFENLKGKFLDKLVFAVNQPSRQELKEIITGEMRNKDRKNYLETYNELRKKMFCWLEEYNSKTGTYITEEVYSQWVKQPANENLEQPEKYNKSPWVAAMVPRVKYNLELFTFYIHRAFEVHEKDYENLSIKIGELRTSENNYVNFNYGDKKCTCIYTKNKNIREGSKEEVFSSIDEHFKYFLKLKKEGKEVENFVISVEGFELEKGTDFVGEINLEKVEGDKILKDFLCIDGEEDGFYKYSPNTRKEFINKLEPLGIEKGYNREELTKLKEEFLEKLVFANNQLDRKKLESINKEKGKYKEVVLRWLESAKGMRIGSERVKGYLDDIKKGKTSKWTYEIAEKDKDIIGLIDSFVRTIVGKGEARRFRELKEFLTGEEGVGKFRVLEKNQARNHVSSMLCGVGEDAVSAFNRLYDMLFNLEFFKDNPEVIKSISSMLSGAGQNALEDLEVLCKILSKKREINGKETTCLEFFKNNPEVMKSISSMLSGAGQNAHTALDKLLTTKININGKETTCLEFFKKNKEIMKSISSMLNGAGQNAHTALEDLLNTLNKDRNINGEQTTCLEFFKNNPEVMKSISSMLNGAGQNAHTALEDLLNTLNKDRNINGEQTTCLEFFKKNKEIMKSISSMLNGARKNAHVNLIELLDLLFEKEYLKDFDNVGLKLSNFFAILHRGTRCCRDLKKLHEICFDKKGKTTTFFTKLENKFKNERELYKKLRENVRAALDSISLQQRDVEERETDIDDPSVFSDEEQFINGQGVVVEKKLQKKEERQATFQQQDNSLKRKSARQDNCSKRGRTGTKVRTEIFEEERREVFSQFVLSNFPNASIEFVRQSLYSPFFEKHEANGRCIPITHNFSQVLFLQGERFILSNLKALAENCNPNKQISERKEREGSAFRKLLQGCEQQLCSDICSLPYDLMRNQDCKTLDNLSKYIAEIEGDFAIHLVTRDHVVAVYRTGGNYAYFDCNIAFVSGLKSIDHLMQVVEKGIKFASYKVEEKGFLVEHFDVDKANSQLSNEDKQILAKEIKTERQLLAEQDKELGPIKSMVNRVQLYDFGTKINVEGSVPLLINAEMSLSSRKFQDHLDKKEVSMTAREYLDNLKNSKNVEEVVQATKTIPFIGSKREIEEAKQTRKPKQSLLELAKGIINCILAAVSLTSASWSKSQLPEKAGNEPQTYLNDSTVDKQLQKSL